MTTVEISGKTAITRQAASVPVRKLMELGLLPGPYTNVLHFGEGRAYTDTAVLGSEGAFVRPYDPNSENPTTANDIWLTMPWEAGYAIYVFNTLPEPERSAAFQELISCCDRVIIAMRTDHVDGQPFQDGVITKRGTFQSQLDTSQWLTWVVSQSPKRSTFNLLYSGSKYVMIEVVKERA